MSAYGMTLTVLATQLAEAVAKDETPEAGGCDLSAGMYGPHASAWLRTVAEALAAEQKRYTELMAKYSEACADAATTADRCNVLTDDMLRYAMGCLGTGSPQEAKRLRAFWRFAIEARKTKQGDDL